jgi:hypothetical protein
MAVVGVMAVAVGALAPAHAARVHGDESDKQAVVVPSKDSIVPGTGFEGRILLEGKPAAGVVVFAYLTFEDVLANKPYAASAPSAEDGTYSLDLPPALFFLVAKKRAAGNADGPVATGDLTCYQGSNPIRVAPGSALHVGFVLTRREEVTFEPSGDAGSGAVEGTVVYQGEPVEGATVFLYLDNQDNFRGMVYSQAPPTGKSGKFRLDNLPHSEYFVVARKRPGRSGSGPLSDGDYFGYYVGNPVPVQTGKRSQIKVELVEKVGAVIDEGTVFADTETRISGRVTDKNGKVVPGVYAFAYLEKVMAHRRPEAISRVVDDKGNYVINLEHGGTYYLGARSTYGEGPVMGEWYGRYDITADHSLVIQTGQKIDGVDIIVEHILP